MPMTSFRRSAKANSAQKKFGGGGKKFWFERWRIPDSNAAPFVLMQHEYVDPNPPPELVSIGADGKALPVKNMYFKVQVHKRKLPGGTNGRFLEEVCSKGSNPHNPQPCAGCKAMDLGDKTVTLSDKFVFGIVHLAKYHKHPLFDYKTGTPRLKQDQTPIYSYTECEGKKCNFCKLLAGQQPVVAQGETWFNYNPADISTEFGRRRYIEIGKGHLSNLEGWEDSVSSQCSTAIVDQNGKFIARCGQQLITENFSCSKCGQVVIDPANDPRDDAQILDVVTRPVQCHGCGFVGFLNESSSCDACTQEGRESTQLSIFNVVLWSKRQGEGTKSQMMLTKFQTVEEFQKSMPPDALALLNGKPLTERISELAQPYDFDSQFTANTLDVQMQNLELNQFPSQGGPQGQQSAYAVPPPPPGGAVQQPQQYGHYPQPGPAPFVPMKPNFSK